MISGTLEAAPTPRLSLIRRLPPGITRLGLIAAVVAVAADLVIGIAVARSARTDLINARIDIHQGIVNDLVGQELLPLATGDAGAFAALDDAIRLRLLGGETVRVKLWDEQGAILYSDAEELVGTRLDVDDHVRSAFAGSAGVAIGELDEVENRTELGLGPLLEFYLPVTIDGETVAAFEIYEQSASFTESLAEIRFHVWTSVAAGLAAVLVAIGSVVWSHARTNHQRRVDAERLLGQVLSAGDDERRRVIGALHDDIGQPLYRVLYGLEGCRDQVDSPVLREELEHLEALVRGIDGSLRSELRMLHAGLVEGEDLLAALESLAIATRRESGLEVTVRGELVPGISDTAATALFRTAREAVINTRKHARSSVITIDLRSHRNGAVVEVRDDGRGWNGREGMGMTTARRRLEAIDGEFSVSRLQGRGTVVSAWVPAGGA